MSMKDINKLKPDWTHRRALIQAILTFLSILIVVSIGGAIGLAFLVKFGIYVSSFFIVFILCLFATYLGIIGSYIFGSAWQTKDFLNILPQIIPHLNSMNTNDTDAVDPTSDPAPNLRDIE